MFTPLILFLGLTVATAVIAHWSDNLGKKLGKKRVSLFGLRPRTTATILTVASSWGIMLFTLAALLIAHEPLKNALFSIDRERADAKRDREQSAREIVAARALLATTRQRFDSASEQLGQAQTRLVSANAAVKTSQQAAQKAETDAQKVEAAARKRTQDAQKRVVAAQERVRDAQQRLAGAQKAEVAARNAEAIAQKQANYDQRLSRVATGNLKIASANLKTARIQLQNTQTQFAATQSNLKSAQSQVRTVDQQLRSRSRELLARSRDLLETERRLALTEREFVKTIQQTEAFATNDAPVKVGQTFAARIIAANQRPETIRTQLRDLLREGRDSFAETQDESPAPAFPANATLQLFGLTGRDASGKPVLLEGERLLQRLASDLRNQTQAALVSVRLVALRNYLAGESRIDTRFVFVPIKPAFEGGELLASATVDGAQGDWRIFRELIDLINLGQRRAEERGVNPPKSPDEPDFYAKGTNVRIFEALRRLEARNAPVVVNLVAFKALSTVEPLQVRFEIEGASGVPTS